MKASAIFFGNPEFAVPSLKALWRHDCADLLAVVSAPDRPVGRGRKMASPPSAIFARENNIPLIQTEDINTCASLKKFLSDKSVDIFFVLAFSQFFSREILGIPKMGAFNAHASLLPKYRGAAPVQYAIWNGDKITGVTIQKMVKKMDAGDILYSREVPISPKDTAKTLFEKMKFDCAIAVDEFLPKLLKGELTPRAQDESQVSFAPILKKSDGLLKFADHSAEQILDQIRAMDVWPGTFAWLNKMRLKILAAERESVSLKPAELSTHYGVLLVGTRQGTLRLSRVQLEGKKACTDTELLNGLKNKMKTFKLETA